MTELLQSSWGIPTLRKTIRASNNSGTKINQSLNSTFQELLQVPCLQARTRSLMTWEYNFSAAVQSSHGPPRWVAPLWGCMYKLSDFNECPVSLKLFFFLSFCYHIFLRKTFAIKNFFQIQLLLLKYWKTIKTWFINLRWPYQENHLTSGEITLSNSINLTRKNKPMLLSAVYIFLKSLYILL